MNLQNISNSKAQRLIVALIFFAAMLVPASAQNLADGLVAYLPLDEVQGTKTPDLVSGYDMDLNNLTAADLVPGIKGKAFSFSNAKKTLLSRVHKAGEALPINQHPAFTISFWEKVNGTGQSDLRLFSEGNTSNSDPLFNLGTHNVDGTLDVFIRQSGWTTVNHITTTGQPLDDQWHHIVFAQQDDGSRKVYIDGVADSLEIPAKEAGTLNVNDTTIGGILRASPGFWVTGLIDDVALWKRGLTAQEAADVAANGVPAVITRKLPLEIRSFTADFGSVAQGDKVVLRWQASSDASLSIAPGVGDVSAQTQFGAGSIEVVVSQTTTFTLTAARSGETITAQTTVRAVPNVAANWRLLENFDTFSAGGIGGKGNWVNPEGSFSVVDLGINKVLGYTDGNALTALPLNSLALREGQKATLFFRIYASPDDLSSALAATFGLTERPIRFNCDFDGNVGPYIRLERVADGATIDLLARNGVGATYDSVVDAVQSGKVYGIWIDIENRPFDVQGGVQMGGDVYSVHIQKEGDASRTTLFKDYVADRDAVNIDPTFGAPGTDLTHLFLSAIGASQGTDNVLFDDFFLSSGGFNSTVPVPASSFVKGEVPAQIQILSFGFNRVNNAFTFSWSAKSGAVYTVQRRTNLSDAWSTLASGFPTGGATGNSATYTDSNVTQATGFYRVTSSP